MFFLSAIPERPRFRIQEEDGVKIVQGDQIDFTYRF